MNQSPDLRIRSYRLSEGRSAMIGHDPTFLRASITYPAGYTAEDDFKSPHSGAGVVTRHLYTDQSRFPRPPPGCQLF